MRGLRILFAAMWWLARHAGQRVDRLVTLAAVRDAAMLEVVEAQFRERAADLEAWWQWQRTRLGPEGESWYRAWHRSRQHVPDDTVSWMAGAPSLGNMGAPAVRDEWYGTVAGELYPDPHADIWRGTVLDPYASVEDAGKRR